PGDARATSGGLRLPSPVCRRIAEARGRGPGGPQAERRSAASAETAQRLPGSGSRSAHSTAARSQLVAGAMTPSVAFRLRRIGEKDEARIADKDATGGPFSLRIATEQDDCLKAAFRASFDGTRLHHPSRR